MPESVPAGEQPGVCQRGARSVFGMRATVLRRVDGFGAKRRSGMLTPARVVEKPARQRNEICLAPGNDCFHLVRVTIMPTACAAMPLAS